MATLIPGVPYFNVRVLSMKKLSIAQLQQVTGGGGDFTDARKAGRETRKEGKGK
jgi:bacteriocin-like protein